MWAEHIRILVEPKVKRVTAVPPASRPRDRYWLLPVCRAVVALAVAAIVTFTALHSATFGLYVFAAFAIPTGLVLGAIGWTVIAEPVTRGFFLVEGVLGVVAGVLALVFHDGHLAVFLYVVAVWAAVTGIMELYCGVRTRPRTQVSRDWMIMGALTAILSLIFLLIPDDAVLAVGLFGAYAVILGVYLAIGGLTEKWGPQKSAESEVGAPAEQAEGRP